MTKPLACTLLGDVITLTPEDWKAWTKEVIAEIDASLEAGEIEKAVRRSEVQFVRGTYIGVLYQSEIYGLETEGRVVSLNLSHTGKKRRCGWGKYVNLYYAYTLPRLRRRGLASALQRALEEHWRTSCGQDRLKSTAGSYAGFRFHKSLGHDFWGANEKGELVVDAPLLNWDTARRQPPPPGLFPTIPRHARAVTASLTPMTPAALVAHLMSDKCPYRQTSHEVGSVFSVGVT